MEAAGFAIGLMIMSVLYARERRLRKEWQCASDAQEETIRDLEVALTLERAECDGWRRRAKDHQAESAAWQVEATAWREKAHELGYVEDL